MKKAKLGKGELDKQQILFLWGEKYKEEQDFFFRLCYSAGFSEITLVSKYYICQTYKTNDIQPTTNLY